MVPNTKYKIMIGTRAYSMTEVREDVYAIRDSADMLLGEIIKIPAHGRSKERWLLSNTRDEFASHTYAIPALEAAHWRAVAAAGNTTKPVDPPPPPVVTVPPTPPPPPPDPATLLPEGWAWGKDIATVLGLSGTNNLKHYVNTGRLIRRRLDDPRKGRGFIYQLAPTPTPAPSPSPVRRGRPVRTLVTAPPKPAPAPDTAAWPSTVQVARHYGMSDSAVRHWIEAGTVKALKVAGAGGHGQIWRVDPATLPPLKTPAAPPAPPPPVVTRRAPNYADVLAELATLRDQVAALQAPKPSLWQRLTGGAL